MSRTAFSARQVYDIAEGQEEADDALGGAALSRGEHEVARGRKLPRQGLVKLEAQGPTAVLA